MNDDRSIYAIFFVLMALMVLGVNLLWAVRCKKEVKRERQSINQQWVQELNERKLIIMNKDGGFRWK